METRLMVKELDPLLRGDRALKDSDSACWIGSKRDLFLIGRNNRRQLIFVLRRTTRMASKKFSGRPIRRTLFTGVGRKPIVRCA
jgi:hypothetical protein